MATSIAGFSALLLSGLPGLSQLGLYSIAGLVAAAAVTRYVLPALLPAGFRVRDVSAIGNALATAFAFARRLRVAVPLLAIAAVAVLATRTGSLWDPDLASLNPIPERAKALDAQLRGALGAPDARIMVAVIGPTADAALAAAESVGRQLDPLVAAGTLSGYESPARFLPSLATQQARRASLPDAATLAKAPGAGTRGPAASPREARALRRGRREGARAAPPHARVVRGHRARPGPRRPALRRCLGTTGRR